MVLRGGFWSPVRESALLPEVEIQDTGYFYRYFTLQVWLDVPEFIVQNWRKQTLKPHPMKKNWGAVCPELKY